MKYINQLLLGIILTIFFTSELFSEAVLYGRVTSETQNTAIENVVVQIPNTNYKTRTDRNGNYELKIQETGSQTVAFSKSGFESVVREINIIANQRNNIDVTLQEKFYNLGDVVVYGASKRLQKVTESPAAIIRLDEEDIRQVARSNQLANAFEAMPGVDILLNGSTDYIVNTRGFNNGLNRRVLVLQDGRDLAMPLLGAQEWNSSALPLDEYSSVEFIKGPASALYGANSFNGVIALTSYAPSEVIGTKVSVTAGDYETFRNDVRHAGYINDKLSYKVTFGRSGSLNLSKSRIDSSQFEYEGVKLERRPIYDDERNTNSKYGTIRFDYDFADDKRIVLEGGYSDSGNETFVQPLGRVLVKDTQRPYGRFAYNSENLNFNASYMRRDVRDSMWLLFAFRGPTMPLGAPILTDDEDAMLDLQYNNKIDILKGFHYIVGISQQFQHINTHGLTLLEEVDANFTGVYGQIEAKFTDKFAFVASGRFDRTNIHKEQFSPRVALVLDAFQNHKFRISASKSFQRPNYSELFRHTPDRIFNAASAGNLQNINQEISDSLRTWTGNQQLADVELGLSNVGGLAVGNPNLKVEQNQGFEIGYQGIINNSIFVTVDVYYNKINDFITNFGPMYNSDIPRWSATLDGELAEFNDEVTDIVYNKLVGDDRERLSIYNGSPTLIQSVGNFGEVDQYGVDLSLNWYLTDKFLFGANYSYYHYDLNLKPGDPIISSNTAPNKANVSLQYNNNIFDCKLTLQYMDTYKWIAGASIGQVPAYTIVNLNTGYKINEYVSLGANIFNLFNTKVLQIFGGTYIPRLATAKITVEF